MNIRETKNEAMSSEPIPIVRSYAGQKEILTLNINVTQNADGEYQCSTLSISHEGRLSASDLIKAIAKKECSPILTLPSSSALSACSPYPTMTRLPQSSSAANTPTPKNCPATARRYWATCNR